MSRARGTPILVRGNSGHGHGPCRVSWLALFSDGRRASDAHLEDLCDPAAITIDVRFLPSAEARDQVTWVNRSNESTSIHRLRWVVGDTEELEAIAPAGVDPIAAVRRIHEVCETIGGTIRREVPRPRLDALVDASLDGRRSCRATCLCFTNESGGSGGTWRCAAWRGVEWDAPWTGHARGPSWDVALPVERRVAGKWDPRGPWCRGMHVTAFLSCSTERSLADRRRATMGHRARQSSHQASLSSTSACTMYVRAPRRGPRVGTINSSCFDCGIGSGPLMHHWPALDCSRTKLSR